MTNMGFDIGETKASRPPEGFIEKAVKATHASVRTG
jgi:hypothetical protein